MQFCLQISSNHLNSVVHPISFNDFLTFLQKSFKVGNGPRGSSWLQPSCSFLLDKSWQQIGPGMATRSVPVWIHSSKAAGIKGAFPGTSNVRCFSHATNWDVLEHLWPRVVEENSAKKQEQLLGWRHKFANIRKPWSLSCFPSLLSHMPQQGIQIWNAHSWLHWGPPQER